LLFWGTSGRAEPDRVLPTSSKMSKLPAFKPAK
jgi:hypothetical protein